MYLYANFNKGIYKNNVLCLFSCNRSWAKCIGSFSYNIDIKAYIFHMNTKFSCDDDEL